MTELARTIGRPWSSPLLAGIAGLVVLAVILEAAIGAGLVPPIVVARPSDTLAAIAPLHRDMDLVGNFLVTFGMTFAAIALAITVGVPLGYLLYRREVL